ncbi:DNA cytosine methyltransferase [Loktanella salsilacus]|nr:DNA cytosine methyltransferase [Loktanella salsilacus]
MKKHTVVSMFSGCGGMDLGFLGGFDANGKHYAKNPFEIVWANDLNPNACRTYEANLGHQIHVGSVWDHIDTMPESCDVVIGGFPCQDISINGKRAGVAGARSGLYKAMVDAVEKMRPRIFVAENVRGLLYAYNKDSLAKVLSDFTAIGYDVSIKLYHAAAYGVPQKRERVMIVGVLNGSVPFEHPTPLLEKPDWVSSRSAIEDLEGVDQDPEFSHVWSLARASSDQGSRVLNPDVPAHTIRAECHGNNQFHYKLPRRISMREAARFQTFPDKFIFHAKLRETERMIGNAVPPVLGWHVAGAVLECLEKTEGAVSIAAE